MDRVHAEIRYHGLRWLLHDLANNPKHPTFVNHQPVSRHTLNADDLIQVGKVKLQVVELQRETMDEAVHKAECAKQTHATGPGPSIDPKPWNARQELVTRTLATMARTAEMRDLYPSEHPQRVADYAILLADELKLSDQEKQHLQIGALLHDIGKSSLDNTLLCKAEKYSAEELQQVQAHSALGAGMLDAMAHLAPIVPIVRHHHERWDGSGYPDSLVAEQIPLPARIIAVVDSFEAMTSRRPYRPALPVEQAFVELVRSAGKQFDPACVYAFLRLRSRIEKMLRGEN